MKPIRENIPFFCFVYTYSFPFFILSLPFARHTL